MSSRWACQAELNALASEYRPEYGNASQELNCHSAKPSFEMVWQASKTNLEGVEQQKDQPNPNCSSKRLIARACRQVLGNTKATPKEKLQAAAILERLVREKDLASRRRKRKKPADCVQSNTTDLLADLLEQS